MLPEIKAQWVAALRSGEFLRGQGYLTRVNADGSEQDCCLGVLCKLAIKAGIPVEVVNEATWKLYDGEAATPSLAVSAWAMGAVSDSLHYVGVSFNPMVEYDGNRFSVAELNDGAFDESGKGLDFNQIADLIDAQL